MILFIKRAFLFQHFLGWLFFTSTCCAQNLVPNPSFEDLYHLPGCDIVADKAEFESIVKNWTLPTLSTTDIHSTDLNDSCITSQPNSTAKSIWVPTGSQLPRTGHNFAAIYENAYYREYLEVQLTTPLVVGKSYCCEMYVSLAEGSGIAQNQMDLYFSDTLVSTNDKNPLYFIPQIVEADIIDDSINWVKVSGSFTAKSAYRYLLIGNFANIGGFDTRQVGTSEHTYYYIDDISVEQIIPPPLIINGTTRVCSGDSIALTASGWSSISWAALNKPNIIISDSATLKTRVTSARSYLVYGYVCGTRFSDTVTVDLYPSPVVHLGNDTLICSTASVLLDAGSGFHDYQWKALSSGQILSTMQTLPVSLEDRYAVYVTSNEGCKGGDTLQLLHYKNPSVKLGPDIYTCTAEGMLNAKGHAYDTYQWKNGSGHPVFYYNQEGTYWVTVENPCGVKAFDTITIYLLHIFVPNLITPDGNGLNDQFKVVGGLEGKGNLSVYNRYGTEVYHNSTYKNEWDGSGLSDGVYYYIFSHPACEDKVGWLQIIGSDH